MIPCYLFVFFFLNKKKAPVIAHCVFSRAWANFLIHAFGIKLKIKGAELLDINQTYVFVANHRSMLDIPAFAVATKHAFRFLSKEELTKIPLLGYVIKNLYITVNRKDKAARIRSMEKMAQSLSDGISVFICPEGTRNITDKPLLDFHDGAFRLAIQAQVPVAVMVLFGSDKLLSPKRPLELAPGSMTCQWTNPIETKGMTPNDIVSLREKVMDEMKRMLN